MSITLSTLFSKTPIKLPPPQISPRFHYSNSSFPLIFSPLTKKAKPLNKLQVSHSFYGSFKKSFHGLPANVSSSVVKAQYENGSVDNSGEEETDVRGESSMPERFRYLTKEVPEKPIRWPLLIGELTCAAFPDISLFFFCSVYMHLPLA